MSPKENNQNPSEPLEELEKGDKILFDDRKTPCKITNVKEEEIEIKGPQGGEYILYTEEDAKHPLKAKPGNKEYSSYVKDLRRIGEWEKQGKKVWKHSKTGAKMLLEKNSAGFWTISTENLDVDLDLPKYGFSSLENAKKQVKTLLNENPEG